MRLKIKPIIILFLLSFFSLGYPRHLIGQQMQRISLVSVSEKGHQGNGPSYFSSISSDGRFVAFHSEASNLVAGDNNNAPDIFVRDRRSGQTTRVSISSNGEEANGASQLNSISGDGRYVAFQSFARNLVEMDGWQSHAYLHDRRDRQTSLVSVSSDGTPGNNHSAGGLDISGTGRFVTFSSAADNLVVDDTNGESDVFVHDRVTGQTTRVSVSDGGVEGNDSSWTPSISGNGRYVAFHSAASNLIDNDNNRAADVFVHDRQIQQTTRVSIASNGAEGRWGGGADPSISSDGRFVVFSSDAHNLVENCNEAGHNIYRHDRIMRQTICITENDMDGIDENEGVRNRRNPSISRNGRYITYQSYLSLGGNRLGQSLVYLYDHVTRQTTLISTSRNGGLPNGRTNHLPRISNTGRQIVFSSNSNDMLEEGGDVNQQRDIFVFDLDPGGL